MAYQINDCDAEFVIVMSLFYDMIKGIRDQTKLKHIIVTNIKEYFPPLGKLLFTLATEKKGGHYVESLATGDLWFQDLLKRYDGRKSEVEVSGNDLALFQYTGGTTGVSKGAMATHKALVANMFQAEAWISPLEPNYDEEISLGAIPMFHVFGMVLVLSASVTFGARIALVVNARDIDDLIDVIDTFKVTMFFGVPALFNAIANHPRVKSGEVSLKSITAASSGSAPLPAVVQRDFERLTSGRLGEGFGMSEAPTATHGAPAVGERRMNSIGLPWPDMDMRIASPDDGETDMPVGEPGELVMAGPNIMTGYHNMPEETAKVLKEKDGKSWLFTGDVAYMDEDGFFYIVDRMKDMRRSKPTRPF
jgi:long-chain acyl-CoA synthetase